ncbi:hypothetical protein PIB30_012117 [Stylosanthes scabra]|uniref:Uncharacterized protein n=1 Tax=Stylosanthes scabra TaxID=79078 RepID=A0ABU6R6S9_9FABA|nr:hypothetical protein [Stylosanthes scabra]
MANVGDKRERDVDDNKVNYVAGEDSDSDEENDYDSISWNSTKISTFCGRGSGDEVGNSVVGETLRRWVANCTCCCGGAGEEGDEETEGKEVGASSGRS